MQRRMGLNFDGTISVPTLIVFLAQVVAVVFWVATTDARMNSMENDQVQFEIDLGAAEQTSVGIVNELARVEREKDDAIALMSERTARVEERLTSIGSTMGEMRLDLREIAQDTRHLREWQAAPEGRSR